jgi:transcriptional regulator
MYGFPYFKDQDPQSVHAFMQAHPFVTLIGSFSDGRPVATQVPVLLVERAGVWFIQAHIMRKTDHHKALLENPQALVLFTGPAAYVSASWYQNPGIGSTWNYQTVQVSGRVQWMEDAALQDFMRRFTLHYEGGNTDSPTFYDNLPASFIDKMMPAIVGLELEVKKPEHTFKLSQNRDAKSYENIIAQLEARGGESTLVAQAMRERQADLFPPGKLWDASAFES